jgi:hypothetical protein
MEKRLSQYFSDDQVPIWVFYNKYLHRMRSYQGRTMQVNMPKCEDIVAIN